MIRERLEQIEIQLEKTKMEVTDIEYFIENALCKETKDIYQQTLKEKQGQLHILLSQKEQLLNQLKSSPDR
jgi:hypothetical protein